MDNKDSFADSGRIKSLITRKQKKIERLMLLVREVEDEIAELEARLDEK